MWQMQVTPDSYLLGIQVTVVGGGNKQKIAK